MSVLVENGVGVISNEEVVAAVKQYAAENPASAFRVKAWLKAQGVEMETLVVGAVPPEAVGKIAVNGRTFMLVSKGAKVLGVIGIFVTATDLSLSAYESYQTGSPRPLAVTTARNAGGFAGSIAGAKLLGTVGAAAGIETGPGVIITGGVGAVVGFFLGEKATGMLIEIIEKTPLPSDPIWPHSINEPPWQM